MSAPPEQDRTSDADEYFQLHRQALESLEGYSEFLSAWQKVVEDEGATSQSDASSNRAADFESFASKALFEFITNLETNQPAPSGDPLSGRDCSAIVASADGMVQQTNHRAIHEFGLVVGKTLDQLGMRIRGDESLPHMLQKYSAGSSPKFNLLHVQMAQKDAHVAVAVTQLDAPEAAVPLYLFLFLSPPDAEACAELVAQKFDLTKGETLIAQAFLDGASLREIAQHRGRSYTTIRNQFQSILEKSGCTSQVEFFRLSFSLYRLLEKTVVEPVRQDTSYLRKMVLPRPGGRSVEVVISGRETGRPLINMPSLFGHGITPEIAALLDLRNVMFISIMRPGFGDTSRPLKTETLFDCVASDTRAVLNTLEIDTCPCLARASAARPFYNLLNRLPDRISNGVIVNGMVPRNFISGKTLTSKWTTALMSASIVSYPVARLIMSTGNSLLQKSSGGTFLKRMYQGSQSDQQVLEDDDVVRSIRTGVEGVTHQGTRSGVEEIVDAFKEWGEDVRPLQTQVTMLHGEFDPNVPILAVRDFAESVGAPLALREYKNAGGQMCYSHFADVLDACFEGDRV